MIRLLIYVFPAAMDAVLAMVLFVCGVRLARLGIGPLGVSSVITLWAAAYMCTNALLARFVTAGNARTLLIVSSLLNALLAVLFSAAGPPAALYALVAVQGAATAVFFAPFQVFMKGFDTGEGGINRSVGLYTLSWSAGYAIGPFAAGWLWPVIGWRGCHLLNALLMAAMAACFALIRPAGRSPGLRGSPEATPTADAYASMPDLAWMAWVFGGIGGMAITLVRGVFPCSGQAAGLSSAAQGMVLFTISTVQALVGLALGRGRWWMYRPLPILGFGILGTAGLLGFAAAGSTAGFCAAAVPIGIWSGSFYFYFVFHALVHARHGPRYVSINEAVVGLTGILGPLAGGWLGGRLSLPAAYAAIAALVGAGVLLQSAIHRHLDGRLTAGDPAADRSGGAPPGRAPAGPAREDGNPAGSASPRRSRRPGSRGARR